MKLVKGLGRNEIPVFARRRPLVSDARCIAVKPGESVRAIVDLAYPEETYRAMARVAIDGVEVPAELWESREAQVGDVILITLVPGLPGLGFGSNTLRNVLTLAFTIGGAAITQFVGGVEGWIIGTALTLVGPFILNLLIPPAPIQELAELGYSLRGTRNQITPWECIPKIYGRHKVFPPLGARPFTETIGDELFLRALFVVGFGPLVIEELKIGDQPVLTEAGEAAFEGMEIEIRPGLATDQPITLVAQDIGEEAVGQEIIFEGTPLVRTTEAATDEISLDIEFPQGLGNQTGDGVNGWSVFFRIQYRPAGFADDAWLEINEPLAAALNDISTIQTIDGRIEYLTTLQAEVAAQLAILEGIDLEDRIWPEDVALTMLEYIQIWINALLQMNDEGDATYADTIADFLQDLYSIEDVFLTFEVGTPVVDAILILRSLDKIKIALDFLIELRRVNDYIADGYGPQLPTLPWWQQLLIRWRGLENIFETAEPEDTRITASKTGIVRRGFRWRVPRGTYEVRVIRTSEPADTEAEATAGVKEQAFWSVLRSIHYQDPVVYERLPPLAMIAMRVKASEQFNGVLNQLNLIATSILPVPVPDGEGGFDIEYQASRNPAHAFIDCLTGTQQPRALTMDRLDMAAIYAWAQACDEEEFTEEDGPTKTGRTFDLVTLKDTTAEKMARTICAAGKAGFNRRWGLYSVVRDVEQSAPVQHFTPANSSGFRGEKNHAEQPHALRVVYLDETRDWAQSERLVFNDGFDIDTATNYESLRLTGVTDSRQAWADARYFLAVSKLRPRRFSWSTDLNWAIVSRGQLVRVTHDVPLWGLAFGRIVESATAAGVTTLRLDNYAPLTAEETYQLIAVYSDGFAHTVTLDAVEEDGHYFEVSFTGSWPSSSPSDYSAGGVAFAPPAMFMIGTLGNVTHDLIVTDIEPDTNKGARITAVDAAPGVYRDPNDPIPPFDPNVDIPPILEIPAPPAPVIRVYPAEHPDAGDPVILSNEQVLIVNGDGTLTPQIVVALVPAVVTRGRRTPYRLQRQLRRLADFDSGQGADTVNPWAGLPDMPADVLDVPFLPVIEAKRYDLRLRYVSEDGLASPWTLIENHTVIGKTSPPPDVASLYLENFEVIRWRYPSPPVDFRGFLVRASSNAAATWESAFAVFETPIAAQFYPLSSLPAGAIKVFVKAVDTGGRESTNAAILAFTNTTTIENIVEEFVFDSGHWEEDPVLSINVWINPEGNLEADGEIMAAGSGITDSSIVAQSDSAYIAESFTPGDPAGAIVLLGLDTSTAPYIPARLTYEIEMEQGNAVLVSTPDFSNIEVIPQSKQYENDGETYALALLLTAAASGLARRPVVDRATLVFDTPDLEEILEDVTIASGGARLTLTRPFRVIKIVNVAIQDVPGNAATSVLIVDKQANPGAGGGPLLRPLDDAGADATGILDARIRGY